MQGVFTKILNLWIPNKTDKGTVVTDVFEPNFTKLDQYAEATNQTLEDLKNNKLEKGIYNGKASDLDNAKLDKGTYSGNAGNLKAEIDLNLVKNLGLEFGGELNNNNLKQAGKAYWNNVNKSIYKCLVDTTLNYADASKFEAISNNDLLLKLQNLFNFRTASVSNTFGVFNFYSFGYFAMCSIVNLDTKDHVSKKTVVSKDEIPSWFATRTGQINFSISGVDLQRVGPLECVFNNDSGISVWGNVASASGQFSIILDKN